MIFILKNHIRLDDPSIYLYVLELFEILKFSTLCFDTIPERRKHYKRFGFTEKQLIGIFVANLAREKTLVVTTLGTNTESDIQNQHLRDETNHYQT